MNTQTFLACIPDWALNALINGYFDDLTAEQANQVNDWTDLIAPNGFICGEPNEWDQPDSPMIPSFGPIAPAVVVWFTIFVD